MARPEGATQWQPTAPLPSLQLRAGLLARVRQYFAATGALEVETPALVRSAVTDVHLESLRVVDDVTGATQGYLHTSPEYGMKRLLCAGAPDIYQLCRVYRAAERGRRHNPEFTMLEWYRLRIDHHALMRDVEAVVHCALEGHRPRRDSEFVTYQAAFAGVLHVDPLTAPVADIRQAIEQRGAALPASMHMHAARDDLLDFAMSMLVTPSFASDRLTFVYDFPASQAALARIHGAVAARFEAFWGPLELANGFHELADAEEQRLRFAADRDDRRARGRPDREPDPDFIAALRSGLPDCAGVALGFDRLVMTAAQASSIDDVMAFPYERA